jgi:hypothetical protein
LELIFSDKQFEYRAILALSPKMSSWSIFVDEYDYDKSRQWLIEHQPFLLKSVTFYIVAIFTIKFIQKDRKPFHLLTPLIGWNAFLAIFSLLGFIFTTPAMLSTIHKHGIKCKVL